MKLRTLRLAGLINGLRMPGKTEALSTIRRAASLARKTFAGGKNGGRKAKGPRCACGAMSAKRALARGHRC